ncbi:MAG: hypothetical protein ACQETI_10455 [Halobacteriota archaeon]
MKVSLRGDDGTVRERVEAADVDVVDSGVASVVIAVGEDGLLTVVEESVEAPVLPVGVGDASPSIPMPALSGAVEALVADRYRTVSHPVIDVSLGDERVGRALMDASLVTTDPARISEYAVADEFGSFESFRGDGVVAATPLGSVGYARAAGSPRVGPGAGVSVVPIAPYTTHPDMWVLRPPVTLSVERDESPVTLAIDGRVVASVDTSRPVRLDVGAEQTFVHLPGVGGRR